MAGEGSLSGSQEPRKSAGARQDKPGRKTMPVLSVTEEDIIALLSQLPSEARERILQRFDGSRPSSVEEAERSMAADQRDPQYNVLSFLDILPEGPRSAATWAEVERNFQKGRNSWDR